jgi:hypothetical protein
MWGLRRLSHAYSCRLAAQGCAMRMVHECPLTRWPIGDLVDLRSVLAGLVLVDLPVDIAVVLEQQERAGQGERIARSARERGWSAPWEHVFVKIGMRADGCVRTYVRICA